MSRRQFGTVQRRGPGVYRIFWTDEQGERQSKTVHGERRDADLELGRIQGGLESVGSSETVRGFWERRVWPSCAGLKIKTRDEYERLYWREVDQRIGTMRLRDATWQGLQRRVIDEIASPSVQRSTARLLSKMFNMAKWDRLLPFSPCEAPFRYLPPRRREKVIVDTLGILDYLEEIQGIKYEPPILAMLGGGLRLEEAAALDWEDIEPWEYRGRAYAVLTIADTLVSATGGAVFQPGETKNEQSGRIMVVGEPFASRLLGLRPGRGGPLVASPVSESGHTSPMTMAHNWGAWCGRHGVDHVRLGDMRTCWSTMHAEAGSPDSLVSLAMGHSDGTTRGSHYLRRTLRSLARLADCLTDAIEEAADEAEG